MGSRTTAKWRKLLILGIISYLAVAIAFSIRAELNRYAMVPVSQDEWPTVTHSIVATASTNDHAITPRSVYLDKGTGAYFIEYSYSNESLRLLIDQFDLIEVELKATKDSVAYRWPAQILRRFDISVEDSRMFSPKNDNEGDFVYLLSSAETILLRYVYNN